MRLASIQILRALAALFVTIYHIRAIEGLAIEESGQVLAATGLPEVGLVGGLWVNGFSGVDLFFVISGFIMVYVTQSNSASLKNSASFLFARATRIFPVWWLFATIMVVYFLLAYGAPVDVEQAAISNQTVTAHLLKSYFLVPQPVFPVLGVGWTLVHELYFYFVFAFALLLPRKYLPYVLGAWAIAVTAGSLGGLSGGFATDYPALVFYPMTMEFIAGAFAGLLIISKRIWRPGLISILSLIWLLSAMQFMPAPESRDGEWVRFVLSWGRVLAFGVPCVCLVYGLVGLDVQGRLETLGGTLGGKIRSGLSAVGDWSFSLYLCHMLVLSALRRIFPFTANIVESQLGLPTGGFTPLRLGSAGVWDNLTLIVMSFIATLTVSWLAYRGFERPLNKRFGKMRRHIFAS